MVDGLILLGFIAIVIVVVTGRVMRRMGIPVRRNFYAIGVVAIAIAVLALWATQRH